MEEAAALLPWLGEGPLQVEALEETTWEGPSTLRPLPLRSGAHDSRSGIGLPVRCFVPVCGTTPVRLPRAPSSGVGSTNASSDPRLSVLDIHVSPVGVWRLPSRGQRHHSSSAPGCAGRNHSSSAHPSSESAARSIPSEHLPGVHDALRVEASLERPHDLNLLGLGLREHLPLEKPDSVFPAHGSSEVHRG